MTGKTQAVKDACTEIETLKEENLKYADAIYDAYFELRRAIAIYRLIINAYGFDDKPSEWQLRDIAENVEQFSDCLHAVNEYMYNAEKKLEEVNN